MSANVTTLLAGSEQLIRALKLSVPKTKARVVAEIHKHTSAIAAKAKAGAPRVTGELAGTIRDEYSQDGLVGFVKVGFGKLPRRSRAATIAGIARAKGRVRKVGRGAYAPVVERGDPRRHHLPHPFLDPPYQADKPKAIADITPALNDSMNDIASEAHP
jgi:hypothetical protein